MTFKKQILSVFLIISLLLTGCRTGSIPTNANIAFENFTYCFFQQEVSSNTINLHYSLQNPETYGITDIPISLGSYDIDPAASLASIENWEASLKKFSFYSLSQENQLTYEILSDYFSSLKEGISYYLYNEPLSPITGIHTQLPVLLAEYQLQNKQEIDTYLQLLQTMPDYFDSLIRFQQQKSAAGLFMSDSVADDVIEQCNAFLSMGEENYLLSTFEERLNNISEISNKEKEAYIAQNHSIIFTYVTPAYETLVTALSDLKRSCSNNQGVCAFPEGKSYYSYLVASETGSSRTISELKELISKQIVTDLLEMQQIVQENPSVLESASTISDSPETILKSLKERISTAFPSPASVNVEVKYVPEALQKYLSPAFYLIPAIDGFKENTVYINESFNMDSISLFTTLAHEGYPGHLYQTTYFASTNPDPIRTLLTYSGYVEGWATYAEMCSYYISSLEKDYATLLQKNNSLLLGLYAMADIGIHHDGWTIAQTIDFFSQYGISDESTIQEIYHYIVGDPANYVTYYVGYVEILELKRLFIEKTGDKFSQKNFHQKLLELGPAPFDILKTYLFR